MIIIKKYKNIKLIILILNYVNKINIFFRDLLIFHFKFYNLFS